MTNIVLRNAQRTCFSLEFHDSHFQVTQPQALLGSLKKRENTFPSIHFESDKFVPGVQPVASIFLHNALDVVTAELDSFQICRS